MQQNHKLLFSTSLFLLFCLFANLSSASPADDHQQEEKNSQKASDQNIDTWYVITWENDLFAFSDDGYTNGLSFGWGHGPFDSFEALHLPEWIRTISQWTYINGSNENNYSIGYGIAQGMYTPSDIEEEDLIVDDRPYAGTLLWRTRIRSYDDKVADSLALTLGMAGPASLAEQSQKIIHKLVDATEPMGWDNQIENEPVFRVDAEHVIRFANFDISGPVEFDSNLYTQAGFGNLRSDAGAGIVCRIGNVLDSSFAYINPAPARGVNTLAGSPSQGFNWQVLVSLYGRYVFNDITIDGNTFKDSHSVELIHEQALVSLAVASSWQNWGFIFSLQSGSDTFEEQESSSKFGALSVTYNL